MSLTSNLHSPTHSSLKGNRPIFAGANWYDSFSPTLMYDLRDLTAGAVASVSSTGSNTLALVQAVGAAQPTAEADSPYALGDELITDGAFTDTANWSEGAGFTVTGGVLNSDGTQTFTYTSQGNNIPNAGTYFIVHDVLNYVSGTSQMRLGGVTGENRTADGTYTEFIDATGVGDLRIFSTNPAFNGDIDNVSTKEITSEGMGLYNDGGDSLAADPSNTSLGLTGTDDVVTLFVKVFHSEDIPSTGVIFGKGRHAGGSAPGDRAFELRVASTGVIRADISDGTTSVVINSASAFTYGSHTYIMEASLAADTLKVWDNDSLIINGTAGGLTSFNDAVLDGLLIGIIPGYSSFHGMLPRALTTGERAIINAQ